MRTRPLLAFLIAGLSTTAIAAPAEARINQRQTHQQHRISQGINSGSLTAREVNRLQRQQGHIAAYEARSRADGPGMTNAERLRLENMQDRASRNIYHQKHDRQRGE
jgi:hypothetical protein